MIRALIQNHKYSGDSAKISMDIINLDLYASETYFVGFASGISADHDFVLY